MRTFFDKLYRFTCSEFYTLAEQHLFDEKRMFVVTANPEIFMQAERDQELRSLLLDEDTTLIADGIGIVKGARMIGVPVKERIPGVELAEALLSAGNKHQKSVYLFGAKREVLETLCKVCKEKYPSSENNG